MVRPGDRPAGPLAVDADRQKAPMIREIARYGVHVVMYLSLAVVVVAWMVEALGI
jgi:hypothetical protein